MPCKRLGAFDSFARRGVTATAKINWQNFGLTYDKKSQAGELLVGNQVTITLDVELVKKT